jgi:hypothetical protein
MIPQSRKEFYVAKVTHQYAPEFGLVVGWSYDSSKEDVTPFVLTKLEGQGPGRYPDAVLYTNEPRIWSSSGSEPGMLIFGEDMTELQDHIRAKWPEKFSD